MDLLVMAIAIALSRNTTWMMVCLISTCSVQLAALIKVLSRWWELMPMITLINRLEIITTPISATTSGWRRSAGQGTDLSECFDRLGHGRRAMRLEPGAGGHKAVVL